MEEYDPHLSVDPISSSLKHPDYNVRKITFDNLNKSVETPFKVFQGKNCRRISLIILPPISKKNLWKMADM